MQPPSDVTTDMEMSEPDPEMSEPDPTMSVCDAGLETEADGDLETSGNMETAEDDEDDVEELESASHTSEPPASNAACRRAPPRGNPLDPMPSTEPFATESEPPEATDNPSHSDEAPQQQPSNGYSDPPSPPSSPTRLQRCSTSLHEGLERGFAAVTEIIVERPKTIIAAMMLVFAVFAQGYWVYTEDLTRAKQWSPIGSEAERDREWVVSRYGLLTRRVEVYFRATSGNIINRDDIHEMFAYHEWFTSVSFGPFEGGGEVSFSEVCLPLGGRGGPSPKQGAPCTPPSSLLSLWDHNRTLFDADPDFERTVREWDHGRWEAVNGKGLPLTRFVSSDADTGLPRAAAALILYELKSVPQYIMGIGEDDPLRREFEIMVGEKTADGSWRDDVASSSSSLKVYIKSAGFQDDAELKELEADINALAIGYFLMVLYASFWMSNSRARESHVLMGCVGVLSVLLATMSAYGFCWFAGVKFNHTARVLILVLLGIGIDDMFIIVESWRGTSKLHDPKTRMVSAMSAAGPTILLTTLTDICAFAAGTASSFPAVRDFCIYACVGVFFDFVFQCVFFVAVFYLDTLREDANKRDLLCCLPAGEDTGWVSPWCNVAPRKAKTNAPWVPGATDAKWVDYVIGCLLPRAILSAPGSVVVCVASAVLLGVAGWGIHTELEAKVDHEWLVPKSSHVQKAIDVRNELFDAERVVPGAYYFGDGFDFASNQKYLRSVATLSQEWLLPGSVRDWPSDLKQWAEETYQDPNATLEGITPVWSDGEISRAAFYPLLRRFTGTGRGAPARGWGYGDYLVWSDDGETLAAAAVPFVIRSLPERVSSEAVNCLRDLRAALEESNPPAGGEVFVFSEAFIYWEFYGIIVGELTTNMAVAAGCVLVLVSAFTANVFLGAIVFAMVAAVNVCILGWMHFFGQTVNAVSGVILVMSVGFTVDYCVHVGHVFLQASSSEGKRHRAAFSLRRMGAPVFNGAFSTFVALSSALFAPGYVITVFGELICLVVLFGAFFGLLVLPVVLSMFGPDPLPGALPLEMAPHLDPLHPDYFEEYDAGAFCEFVNSPRNTEPAMSPSISQP